MHHADLKFLSSANIVTSSTSFAIAGRGAVVCCLPWSQWQKS